MDHYIFGNPKNIDFISFVVSGNFQKLILSKISEFSPKIPKNEFILNTSRVDQFLTKN